MESKSSDLVKIKCSQNQIVECSSRQSIVVAVGCSSRVQQQLVVAASSIENSSSSRQQYSIVVVVVVIYRYREQRQWQCSCTSCSSGREQRVEIVSREVQQLQSSGAANSVYSSSRVVQQQLQSSRAHNRRHQTKHMCHKKSKQDMGVQQRQSVVQQQQQQYSSGASSKYNQYSSSRQQQSIVVADSSRVAAASILQDSEITVVQIIGSGKSQPLLFPSCCLKLSTHSRVVQIKRSRSSKGHGCAHVCLIIQYSQIGSGIIYIQCSVNKNRIIGSIQYFFLPNSSQHVPSQAVASSAQ